MGSLPVGSGCFRSRRSHRRLGLAGADAVRSAFLSSRRRSHHSFCILFSYADASLLLTASSPSSLFDAPRPPSAPRSPSPATPSSPSTTPSPLFFRNFEFSLERFPFRAFTFLVLSVHPNRTTLASRRTLKRKAYETSFSFASSYSGLTLLPCSAFTPSSTRFFPIRLRPSRRRSPSLKVPTSPSSLKGDALPTLLRSSGRRRWTLRRGRGARTGKRSRGRCLVSTRPSGRGGRSWVEKMDLVFSRRRFRVSLARGSSLRIGRELH